jgi:RecA-family ATPase
MTNHNNTPNNSLISQLKDTKEQQLDLDFEQEVDGINGIQPSTMQDHIDDLIEQGTTNDQKFGILRIRSANEVMNQASKQPTPKMLFDEFWFEGELSVLFADTGVGKSLLAVQIGESIASGKPIKGFRMEAARQLVYYFDFELADKQFQQRYSVNYENNYKFSKNFHRGDLTEDEIPDGLKFEDYLNDCFEKAIITTGAKIIIIDNLTRLRITDTDQAKDAKPLMDYLMKLKKKYGVSILALEHTRKRDESKEISLNDLQGSAMKIRLFDAAFTMGRSSQDKNIRYIKQMKARHGENKFDRENVAVCMIYNPDNFTQFEFLNFGIEYEHLKQRTKQERELTILSVKELSDKGYTQRKVSKELGISLGSVNKYLKM